MFTDVKDYVISCNPIIKPKQDYHNMVCFGYEEIT